MKEILFDAIKGANVPRTPEELSAKLEVPVGDLMPLIEEMVSEGRILRTRKGKYAVPEKVGLLTARIQFQRNGSPMANPVNGEPAMPLHIRGGLRCMPGDLVLVHPMPNGCELDSIVSRGKDTFAAYVRIEKKAPKGGRKWQDAKMIATAVPCDLRIPYDVVLKGDISFVRNNEIAQLKIDIWPEQHRPIYASVLRVLGNAGSMRTLLKAVAEDHGFSTELTEEAEAEARLYPESPEASDYIGREDLRALETFTIDGATAKDFDDAVSLEKTENGWRLGVHIADVSHYVRPGSAIDREAFERGTSLYLPGYTVPMLPECLSNNLCSLMPGVDRLAMSLFMDIESGKVVDHRLVRSVIHSHARLTYQAVNRMFDGGETDIPDSVRDTLYAMRDLSHVLRNRRHAKGSIDFEIAEPEFVLNEKNEPVDIICEERGESERIIEDFMLLANETVAALASDTDLPFVYRIHEDPDTDKLKTLEKFLSGLNMHAHIGPKPHPGVLQGILEDAREHPAYEVIRRYMLRALKKAQYSEKPVGHYALALKDYCHFTSPIRRYPDLVVHRMLKMLISGDLDHTSSMTKRMPEIASASTEREFSATHAERQADDIMKASFMSHQIGRKFDGVVSGVTGWGLYVTLPNMVEGLVHISTMDDYFEFDREKSILVGTYTGIVFKMGDRVRVRVDHADVPRGEVNFVLVAPDERKRINTNEVIS